MDNRKTYVRPAVESEVMMEQTSLACNVTLDIGVCAPPQDVDQQACIAPLFKGYNWVGGAEPPCTAPFPIQENCGVLYS